MRRFEGKTALVTGGTRGIGLAITRAFHREGASVVAITRHEDQAAAVRQEFGGDDRARVKIADVRDRASLQRVRDGVDRLHILVPNAGVATRASPGGRVIVTSSISAIHGQKLRAAYCGTKGAVSALARALAVEWGPGGATVNAVAPGIIRTPLIQAYADANPDRVEAGIAHTPLRRLGEPADVADVVLFFASDAARYVTGQILVVDGGMTAGSDWW
jgi:NAD(P)-dependent dehydrogenase (short-subunit alcohol dehydrogenase family)